MKTRHTTLPLTCLALMASGLALHAQPYVWTGGGDGINLFGDGSMTDGYLDNWSPTLDSGAFPVSGDFSINAGAAWTDGYTLSLGAARTINSLAFTGTYAAGLTITGSEDGSTSNALTFATAGGTILSMSGNSGDSKVTMASSVLMNLNYTGQSSVNIAEGASMTIGGAISGTGGLIKTGAGTLTLSATSTFTGGLVITEGNVIANSALRLGAEGSAGTTINGGTITFTTSVYSALGRPYYVGSDIGTFNITATNFRIRGSISDVSGQAGVLVKTGGGTLLLDGANTHTGGTIVEQGRLVLAGASTRTLGGASSVVGLTVKSGGSLAGSGTINGASVFEAGAILNPNTYNSAATNTTTITNVVGQFTFNGTLDISGLASANLGGLFFDLAGTTASDKITLTSGALTIGDGLLGLSDFTFTAQTGFGDGVYTLFSTTQSLVGTLLASDVAGTVGGYDVLLAINSAGNSINLLVGSAIPEPSTWAALIGGLALGTALFRRPGRV